MLSLPKHGVSPACGPNLLSNTEMTYHALLDSMGRALHGGEYKDDYNTTLDQLYSVGSSRQTYFA